MSYELWMMNYEWWIMSSSVIAHCYDLNFVETRHALSPKLWIVFSWLIEILKHFLKKESVEDECGDGVARFAKLRPMWVEMYEWIEIGSYRIWNFWQNGMWKVITYIGTGSGETTRLEMILAVLKKVESWRLKVENYEPKVGPYEFQCCCAW